MMERRLIRGLAVIIMVTMIMVVKGSDPHDHHWRLEDN